ncbi:hypothetical protein HRG_005748 [Hirsutella rhossiliensis]|uniref:Uncharacterized protein n=1 Tax=Hirsutella rhossiliensis TaxID=111463 RepID=A0A9P8MW87_9HYPO|nr:uncharacterized protein HRG_05748 [Hirsutella rhossiliensis]KAH0963238.1 hypothetical protein HRG_05748 [Hirsutella rhossiliensis]
MERHPVPLRLLLLRLLLSSAVVSSSPAATPAAPRLFARADTCAAKGLDSCSNDLPDNFCCPKGSSCISLAAGTTALCCPNDKSCDTIEPITCYIQAQDPATDLKAPVKTTVFDVALQKCGASGYCCPFGYSCSDGGARCSKNKDQSKSPKSEQPSASSTTAAEPSATSTTADSPSSAAAASTTPSEVSDPSPVPGPNKGPLIGGIIGGVAGFIFLLIVIILCVRRSRRAASDQDSIQDGSTGGGSGPYGHVISAPVLHPGSYRSDFLRGNPASPEPPATPVVAPYSPTNTHLRPAPRISIPNPFDSPNPSPYSPVGSRASVTSVEELTARTGHVVGSRLAPIRDMKPTEARYSRRMSTHDVGRKPSFEDINVFADPETVRPSNNDHRITTMSDMMEEVGLGDVHRGRRPYVPGTTPRI